jgi:malonyl CoA-acyl carrier protein transacylase/NAD(P)-dependent dehydrogenase (short-subunit alcohol dehydrogenase family)
MAAELLEESPLFAEQIESCEAALAPYMEPPLTELLRSSDETWLSQVELVQPALFAVMVALAELWRSYGVEPAAVIGHSQGEIAAAVVAGALSLEDGAKLAALRAKSLTGLMGEGEMASVQASAEEVEPHLAPYAERVSIAAHNGPRATVISGEPQAISELIEHFETQGTRARLIPVGYASHCAQIEAIEGELKEAVADITATESAIPFYSTLSGEPLETSKLDADYWYRNLREPVCFRQATERLLKDGHSAFVEVSAHPVLALPLSETAEAQGKDQAAILHTLRREEGNSRRLLTSLAAAHAHGVPVDFAPLFEGTGARLTELPTYPFQRQRYWLEASKGSGDASSLGQTSTEHPLLGASLSLAGEGTLLTGRISQATHPWLAEHAVAGTAILPGTAFVELALRAGQEVGATHLSELILESPLPIPAEGAVQLQVTVTPDQDAEEHRVEIHARPEPTADQDEEASWSRHASATLSDEAPLALDFDATAWPPAGAEPLDTADLYERVADLGLEYGPAFQGLEAAWKLGEEIYGEVSLASEQEGEAARFGLHPALLDAALHAAFLEADPSQGVRLPFSFAGVSLHEGEGASALRVKVTGEGEKLRLEAADQEGNLAASISALSAREIDPAQIGSTQAQAQGDALFGIEWTEVELTMGDGAPEANGTPTEEAPTRLHRLVPDLGLDPAEAAHQICAEALGLLQEEIAGENTSRLAFLSEGAVALDPSESPDPALASVWGLVRSAQSEHPGRFLLIDTDGTDASEQTLAAALAQVEEPQLALREGTARAPRLHRIPDSEEQAPALDRDGTVLVTGGLSGLGALTAKHLVEQGAKHLLLTSRRGPNAPGATELIAELTALGCEAEAIACDVSDKAQVEELVAGVSKDHPLTAVIHSAGVLDDGTIESLDPARLDAVLAPKADAAWNLHEATRDRDLAAFVLYSSAAATFGSPGQGNYAAANSFLDSLAACRRAQGLPATAVAWGMWEQESELVAGADRERLGRMGMAPIAIEQGLEMFDWARRQTRPLVVVAPLRIPALRAAATAGMLPPLFSGLVQVRRRRSQSAASFARRLAAVPEAEREAFALAIVREHAAAVLGHASPDDVDPAANFKDLGFDSLGAVELRNRLVGATGARLEATLVFDRPTPEAIAAYLLEQVTPGAGPAVDPAEAELRRLLAAIPVARLREAGVLDTLRALEANQAAGPDADGDEGDALESIDEMDIDQLVRQTLEPETAEG